MTVYEDEKTRENSLTPSGDNFRMSPADRKSFEKLNTDYHNREADELAEREGLHQPASNENDVAEHESGAPAVNRSSDKSFSPQKLESAESAAASDDTVGKGYSNQPGIRGKVAGLRGRTKKFAKSHKKLLFGASFAGIGVLSGIFIVLFILGTLLIPSFTSHITSYQFARVGAEFADSNAQITGEKIMVDSASDGFWANLGAQFSNLRDGFWGKINSYRPKQIVKNLETNGELDYVYEPTGVSILGVERQKLTAIVIKGETIPVNGQSFADRVTSPIQSIKDTFQLRSDMSDALETSLDGTSTIIRSFVAKNIRSNIDAHLFRWRISGDPKDPNDPNNYTGNSEQDQALATKATEEQVTDNGAALGAGATEEGLSNLADGENAAKEGIAKCVEDPECLKTIVDTGDPVPPSVVTSVAKAVNASGLETAIGYVNPIYKWAVPLCIVYDGSLEKSQGTVDNQSAELERTYVSFASAGNQQMSGDQVTGAAVGGLAKQAGGTASSNPEVRASGGVPDTSNTVSAQRGAGGEISLLNTFLPGPVASFFNGIGGTLCPAVTNVWVGAGLGVASITAKIAADIASGGSAEPAQDALEVAATQSVSTIIKDDLLAFTGQLFSKETLGDLVTTGGLTAGATFVAKMVVAQRASLTTNGLAQNESIVNQADEGGNIYTNGINQQMFYGRPMTNVEVAGSNVQSQNYLANQTKMQSAYQRYFALSNPNSLLTNFGMTLQAHLNSSVFSSIFSNMGKILSPLSSLMNLFGSMNHLQVYAADGVDRTNYGIVQWGWSPSEENLINTDATYEHPLVNDQILDASGNAQAIADKYEKCFGHNPDGTPNPTYTMGYMLANGWIQRNPQTGSVDPDNGDCSPNKLTYTNNEFGPAMVFRWRLSHRTNNVLDHQMSIQNAAGS